MSTFFGEPSPALSSSDLAGQIVSYLVLVTVHGYLVALAVFTFSLPLS